MSKFTPDEIDGIVKAMSQPPPSPEEGEKIPLLEPGSYGNVSKLSLSPLDGEKPRPLEEFNEKDLEKFNSLKVPLEVVFGKTRLTLKELSSLKKGSLLPLDELCDDLLTLYVHDLPIARAELVAVDEQYGVRIVSFIKN